MSKTNTTRLKQEMGRPKPKIRKICSSTGIPSNPKQFQRQNRSRVASRAANESMRRQIDIQQTHVATEPKPKKDTFGKNWGAHGDPPSHPSIQPRKKSIQFQATKGPRTNARPPARNPAARAR